MEITNKQILDLVKKYPNNLELGQVIRTMSYEMDSKNINEVYVNPRQITIYDLLNHQSTKETKE